MQKLIKLDRESGASSAAVVEADWVILEKGLDAAVLNERVSSAARDADGVLVHWHDALVGHLLDPALREELGLNNSNSGIWLDSDDDVEALGTACQDHAVIALNFPKFVDGRSYSSAYLLRKRFGFNGELRAIGDVLVDQMFYMQRCGFDTFALREDKSVEAAIGGLKTFSVRYQASVDRNEPLFRVSDRPTAA